MNITYALCAYPFGWLSDRFSKVKLLAGAFILNALVYAGFGFSSAPWQIWLLFVLYGLYLGMSQGVLSAMVADWVDKDGRGTAFGLLALATGITLLPASIIAGVLWDRVSPMATFVAGSAFAVVATLILLLMLAFPTCSEPAGSTHQTARPNRSS
jgi:MFS family permease